MAQSLSSSLSSHTVPFHSKLGCDGYLSCYAGFPGIRRLVKPVNGVRAMAADRRENLDHLQRSGAIKRREAPAPAATLGLWDRFPTARTVQQMMETMERMMEEPLVVTTNWPAPSSIPNDGGSYARGRTPWAIKEGETEYKLRFDMPGMTREDTKVWVEEKMLVIKAEKAPKAPTGQENGSVQDEGDWPAKSFGRYSWRIALPENVEFEKIKAEVKDGVLYVTIPKPSKTTKIFDVSVD